MAEDSIKPKAEAMAPADVSAPTDEKAVMDEKEQTAVKAFFDDFVLLSKKHGYDIGAQLQILPDSIKAVPMIVKLKTTDESK